MENIEQKTKEVREIASQITAAMGEMAKEFSDVERGTFLAAVTSYVADFLIVTMDKESARKSAEGLSNLLKNIIENAPDSMFNAYYKLSN